MEQTLPRQYQEEKAYFMDFEFRVTHDTFIPRPETELLVEKVVGTVLKPNGNLSPDGDRFQFGPEPSLNILDIGTGCGNIAISLTKYIGIGKITALDISDKALSVARENAIRYDCQHRMDFIKSDLFNDLDDSYRGFFDIIVSNPPYISLNDMNEVPGEVKAEPEQALYGGNDGLFFYRRIIKSAPCYLKKNGFLAVETGYDQARAVRDLMMLTGFTDIEVYKDYNGIERVVTGVI